jgi:hypothetical protein
MSTPLGPASSAAQIAALVLKQGEGGANLTLGQIVQVKVLRQLEAGKFLVTIGGRERVIESDQALKPGDVLSLRVGGSRDRIELERVERGAGSKASAAATESDGFSTLGGSAAAVVIEELFRRFRMGLEPDEAEPLKALVGRAERPHEMALAGLVVRKASLPMDAELVQEVYVTLTSKFGSLAPLPAIEESTVKPPRWWPLGQRILNIQGGGSVAHRLGSLQVEFGDEVVEVEIALFEEQGSDSGKPGTAPAPLSTHRKFILSLETAELGRLELRAAMAGQHIRVALGTESAESTNALLRDGESLVRALSSAGWRVDEITHETRPHGGGSPVVAAAVDHLVTPGSLNRVL